MSLDISTISNPREIKFKESYSFYYRLNEEGLSRDMKPNEFADQVKQISSFKSLEEFWSIFQHIRKPDTCRSGTELFLFARDIKPLWEDPNNTNGGKVSIRLRKNFSSIVWEEIIFAFIGEIFPENIKDEITGLVISIRKECNVLQIWFKNYSIEKASILEQTVKDLLMIPDGVEIETKPFFKNYFGVSNYFVTPIINKEGKEVKDEEEYEYKREDQDYYENNYADSYEVKENKYNKENANYSKEVSKAKKEVGAKNIKNKDKIYNNIEDKVLIDSTSSKITNTKTKLVSVDDIFVSNENSNSKSKKVYSPNKITENGIKTTSNESKSSVLIKNPDYEIEINKIITDDIQYEYEYDYNYSNSSKAYEGSDYTYKKAAKRRGGKVSHYEKPVATTGKYKENYYGNEEYYNNREYDYDYNYNYGGRYNKRKPKFNK